MHASSIDVDYGLGTSSTRHAWRRRDALKVTEAGAYTLRAEFICGVTPGPIDAMPFDDDAFLGERSKLPKSLARLNVSSAPVTITVRDGDTQKYWIEALKDENVDVRIVAAATLVAFQSNPGPICAALADVVQGVRFVDGIKEKVA